MKRILLGLFCFQIVSSLSAQKIFTAAGNGAGNSGGDGGPAYLAQLSPASIALDNTGNLYIVEYWNSRVRKVNTSGIISTIAGTGVNGNAGDGGPAVSAQLNKPMGIAVDAAGNIYISEVVGNKIRKINTIGIINTIAGTGVPGYTGDGGPAIAATLNNPQRVSVDGANNIYILDVSNNCVRKIDAVGTITTIAGTGVAGFSGDGGPATSANLYTPYDLVVDGSNNIYIADLWNNRIRKINTSGIITTIAGTGTAGFSGDGGPATSAKLNRPFGIAVDGSGNVFIADSYNSRIRKINSSGIISTIVGTGNTAFSGDGGPAASAEINMPSDVILDPSGNIYICDANNNRIREVCYIDCLAGIEENVMSENSLLLYPQPATDFVNIDLKNYDQSAIKAKIYDLSGKMVQSSELVVHSRKVQIETSDLANGVYFITISDKNNESITKKLVITK